MNGLVSVKRGEASEASMGRMRPMGLMEVAEHMSFMSRIRLIGPVSAFPLGGQP